MTKPNQDQVTLTKYYFEKLQQEKLKLELKYQDVSRKLQEAYENNNDTEDSIYRETLMDKSKLEIELNRINYLLENGKVDEGYKNGSIGFGSTITLQLKDRRLKVTLVDEPEADPEQQKISNKSLLGQALIGKKPGDQVFIQAPAGEMQYSIIQIN